MDLLTSFFRKPAKTNRRNGLSFDVLEDRCVLSAPGAEIHLLATPNDPSYSLQWDMTKIQAPTAWNDTTGSLKVVVANIDSGIDYAHVDLYKNIWINQSEIPAANKAAIKTLLGLGASDPITFWDLNNLGEAQWNATTIVDANADHRIDGRDVLAGWADGSATEDGNGYTDDLVGWNFVANNNNPFDDNGHGTHTAGTIGAIGNNGTGVAGVNWQVQIMALKILDKNGSGDLFDAADAIRYANANGAQVSNNSWGFYDSGETVAGAKYSYLYNAIKETPNVLFVAAAGNNGLNNDTHWARNYPASYNLGNIVSVAATNSRDGKPSWSNYGKSTVDLGAPGDNILSTVPGGYAYYSGTSMATPHVAGAAALALAKYPSLSTGGLKSALISGVDKVNSMSKTVSGGRLNLYKVLTAGATAQGSSGGDSGGSGSTGGTGGGKGKAASQSLPGDDMRSDGGADLQTFLIVDGGSYVNVGPVNAADFAAPTANAVVQLIPASRSDVPAWLAVSQAGSGIGDEGRLDQPEMQNPEPEMPGNDREAMPEVMIFHAGRAAANAPRMAVIYDAIAPAVGPTGETPPLETAVAIAPETEIQPIGRGFIAKSIGSMIWLAGFAAFFAHGALSGKAKERNDQERNQRVKM